MSDLSKLMPICLISLVAQAILNYVGYAFIFSKIKTGIYTIPFLGQFESWWIFTIVAWTLNAVGYIPATVLVVWAYKISLNSFGIFYSAMIIGQIASILMSILFMYLTAGEVPNRNGWIAVALVLVASLFAAHSGKNI